MTRFRRCTRSLAVVCALALGSIASAADATATPDVRVSASERRATALLERAVEQVERHGEPGTTAFSRQAEFVDRDLYVYALTIDGRFLASGGASAALIGQNVLAETDLEGKPFFREMIDIAKAEGAGRLSYRWFNPADSHGEPKLALFRRVGDIIVAVGFYPPRADPAQARALLKKAARALADDSGKALAEFQRLNGPFIRDDLYVFAVDLASGKFIAHGATPSLIGTDARQLRDPDGRPIITEMIERAGRSDSGELDYIWRNPATRKLEHKHTYFRIEGGRLVGVGYYTR